jgi:hypothetical protein
MYVRTPAIFEGCFCIQTWVSCMYRLYTCCLSSSYVCAGLCKHMYAHYYTHIRVNKYVYACLWAHTYVHVHEQAVGMDKDVSERTNRCIHTLCAKTLDQQIEEVIPILTNMRLMPRIHIHAFIYIYMHSYTYTCIRIHIHAFMLSTTAHSAYVHAHSGNPTAT